MSKKITVELDESYGEKLEVLRQVFVSPEGEKMDDNGMLLQGLMDTFMEFLQNQDHDHGDDGHVHGPDCNH